MYRKRYALLMDAVYDLKPHMHFLIVEHTALEPLALYVRHSFALQATRVDAP